MVVDFLHENIASGGILGSDVGEFSWLDAISSSKRQTSCLFRLRHRYEWGQGAKEPFRESTTKNRSLERAPTISTETTSYYELA